MKSMLSFRFNFLWSDLLLYFLLLTIILYIIWVVRHEHLRAQWQQLFRNRIGVSAAVILFVYLSIGLLDSVHLQRMLPPQTPEETIQYDPRSESLLDLLMRPLDEFYEQTYSAPFATVLYSKKLTLTAAGIPEWIYPNLSYAHLNTLDRVTIEDVLKHVWRPVVYASLIWFILLGSVSFFLKKNWKLTWRDTLKKILLNQSQNAWGAFFWTLLIVLLVVLMSFHLSHYYHVFGTDKVGQDIFYQALKSIRTGLLIGTLTTLVMLPFGIFLGTMAGYFGGIIDDVIQYIYTTLNSIPGVLLIAAAILTLQVFMSKHADFFSSIDLQADVRLLALCGILGITSWTGLCRLLRGEALKLRELDYIAAAKALGQNHFKIITRHVIPNVTHIIVISIVIDFSALVLAEAVLSYVGIGVDPTTLSWGNMINAARLELAREPVVWWPLAAAFILMFILVLSANLFSDAVRDAFDPRLRKL